MNSQQNNKPSRPGRKGALAKLSEPQVGDAPPKLKSKPSKRPMLHDASTVPPQKHVLTQEEFKARVSRKAFELYEIRRSVTEVDDWIAAERLVKVELLSEERGAGSV